jgi:hypothetical protein
VRAPDETESVIEMQPLPDQEHDGVAERWLLCRSIACQRKERQIFAARLLTVRERLARLTAQVAAGTFVRADVIQRKAKQAVGCTHDMRGIFSWQLQSTTAAQELRVEEDDTVIEEHRDLQDIYLLRTTETSWTPVDL